MPTLPTSSAITASGSFVLDPANITANTSAEQTVTVNGLRPGFPVLVFAPSLEANLGVTNAHCPSSNTLKFRIINPTAGAINPASQTFFYVQF